MSPAQITHVAAPATLESLGGGFHAYVQPDGGWGLNNAGVFTGRRSTLLVDTCFTENRGKRLRDAVRGLSDAPVTTIVTFRGRPHFAQTGTRDLYQVLIEKLRDSQGVVSAILSYLHGRADRTWRAGHAIRAAIIKARDVDRAFGLASVGTSFDRVESGAGAPRKVRAALGPRTGARHPNRPGKFLVLRK